MSQEVISTTEEDESLHWSRFFHPWWSMTFAIVFELIGTIHTKLSQGATKPWPSAIMFAAYTLCVLFLSFAMDDTSANHGYEGLDLGVVYATWSGIGTIVAALAGVYMYGENLIAVQWFGIALTIVGVALINIGPSLQREENPSTSQNVAGDPDESSFVHTNLLEANKKYGSTL